MKKSLLGLISICILILSCKKEHSGGTPPDQTTHNVGFQVTFSQRTVQFQTSGLHNGNLKVNSLATTALTDMVDVIYYSVYDASGNNVHLITQLSSASGFGSYVDNLHAGTYTVVIAAGKSGMILGRAPEATSSKLGTDIIYYGTGGFNRDAFYSKFSLTVTNSNTTNNVTLDRITSELTVVISDQIPLGVKTMGVVYGAGTTSRFSIGTGTPVTGGSAPPPLIDTLALSDIGTKNHQFSGLFLAATPTVRVQIFAKNGPDNLLEPGPHYSNLVAAKTLQDVTSQANAQTILTGYLFGGNGTGSSGGFTATIDTTWISNPALNKTFP
ncbi:MAG TPA: hypothetical protein VK668_03355 [Mucilaginibacter sp.]|nr:hypothetical protein [Mucilaginibacter sp.]